MIKVHASQLASVYLLAWATLTEIDPCSGAGIPDHIGSQRNKQHLDYDPSEREQDDQHLANVDYRGILTQKTMDLLSEAVAMLNHVRDVKSRRWLDDFVFKIGQLALKITQGNKNSALGDRANDTHLPNELMNKSTTKKKGGARFQKQGSKQKFNEENIRSDSKGYNYFHKWKSDKSWPNLPTTQVMPKRIQTSSELEGSVPLDKERNHPPYSNSFKNQNFQSISSQSTFQLNRTHEKQSIKQKEKKGSPSHRSLASESLQNPRQSNNNISSPELFSILPFHHNKLHRRTHGKENSHKPLHFDDPVLHDSPGTALKTTSRQAKVQNDDPFVGVKSHSDTQNPTVHQNITKTEEQRRALVHDPFMTYNFNHNHHHRSHLPKKTQIEQSL